MVYRRNENRNGAGIIIDKTLKIEVVEIGI
jgi:hypothetical protein